MGRNYRVTQQSQYAEGITTQTHVPQCHAALFTIVTTWKQPTCPSTNEWIKKMRYIDTVEYYSAIKRRNAFKSVLLRWMNLEPLTGSEVSQKEKNKYRILMHILYMESRKIVLMNLFAGQE